MGEMLFGGVIGLGMTWFLWMPYRGRRLRRALACFAVSVFVFLLYGNLLDQ